LLSLLIFIASVNCQHFLFINVPLCVENGVLNATLEIYAD